MCWSSDWEEQELLRDAERREDDERRSVEVVTQRETAEPERERDERELIRV